MVLVVWGVGGGGGNGLGEGRGEQGETHVQETSSTEPLCGKRLVQSRVQNPLQGGTTWDVCPCGLGFGLVKMDKTRPHGNPARNRRSCMHSCTPPTQPTHPHHTTPQSRPCLRPQDPNDEDDDNNAAAEASAPHLGLGSFRRRRRSPPNARGRPRHPPPAPAVVPVRMPTHPFPRYPPRPNPPPTLPCPLPPSSSSAAGGGRRRKAELPPRKNAESSHSAAPPAGSLGLRPFVPAERPLVYLAGHQDLLRGE